MRRRDRIFIRIMRNIVNGSNAMTRTGEMVFPSGIIFSTCVCTSERLKMHIPKSSLNVIKKEDRGERRSSESVLSWRKTLTDHKQVKEENKDLILNSNSRSRPLTARHIDAIVVFFLFLVFSLFYACPDQLLFASDREFTSRPTQL